MDSPRPGERGIRSTTNTSGSIQVCIMRRCMKVNHSPSGESSLGEERGAIRFAQAFDLTEQETSPAATRGKLLRQPRSAKPANDEISRCLSEISGDRAAERRTARALESVPESARIGILKVEAD